MMHLSDADNDIARFSGMNTGQIRAELRKSLMKQLNSDISFEYQTLAAHRDFVQSDNSDLDLVYKSLAYESDTVYSAKRPYSKDSSIVAIKKKLKTEAPKKVESKFYINVAFYDQQLLPDLARQHQADYFIFLNELDIKTNYDDCMDLAMKIYRRELKVHYSVFNRSGKQVYGDVAISHFPSNSNYVDEIAAQNFPEISRQILNSVKVIQGHVLN